MQNTMTSTSDRVSRTTSLSRLPSRLFGLCSPGVSTSTIWPAGLCTTPRMACRVVCGRLLTMPTFSPTRALGSGLLRALGRPTRATKPLRCDDCWGLLTGPVSHRPPTVPATAGTEGTSGTESPSDGAAEGPVRAGEVHGGGRRQVADGGQPFLLDRVGGRDDRRGLEALDAAGHRGGDRGLQRRQLQRRQRDGGGEVGAP